MLVTSNERIGSALNSKNLKSDELHSDADVVAALAFANRLGISLQHIRSGGHINSATTAVSQLSVTLKRACKRKRMGISNEAAARCAEQALREFISGLNLPADVRSRMLAMTPRSYIGLAQSLAKTA